MDVSGTDPRTRTGLFLWPWASYPGVAANAASGQPMMMGAAGPMGVPNTGSGPLNMPAMMEDSIESFYQRFSYPGSHAAQMSHLLPQHGQPGNEARHVSREMHTTSSSSSRSRTQTPQSRSGHLHRTSNDPSSHAAAIAAFTSVAANSAVIGDGPHHSGLVLPHGMHSSRHLQQQQHSSREMTLDNLCNGMNSPNIAISPSKTEGVPNYGLRNVHQINSAALALADLCSGSDKSMDDAGSTRNNSGSRNNNNADDMRGSASTADGYSQHHHYAFSGSKSPMSENQDHRSADSVHEISRMSMDLVRNGRLMPDLRDAFLLRNQNAMRDCSPDDRPSSEYHARPREEHAGTMAHEVPSSTNECSVPGGSSSFTHATKGYKCKICQHVCFSRHDLSAHNAATHKQDPRPYRCEQCGRQFSTGAYLSQHRRIHTGVKPYACRHCGRRFTQLSHVQQHERIHTGEKPYKCTTCLKSFTQMSNLQSHQRQHMKGKPHRCEQCFMSFDSKDELDVHVQAKHSGNRYAKVLVCPICQKSYNSETYLAKHMDRHKEAAAASSSVSNDSLVNAASVNCMDDLFGFSTHPVAMAARLSHHQQHPHQQPHHHRPVAASSAAAAAVARVAADQLTSYIGDGFLHNLHAPFSKLSQLSNPFQDSRPHQTFGAYSAATKRDPSEAGEQQLLNLTQQPPQTPRRLPPPAHQQCPPETGSRTTSPRQQQQQQPQQPFMMHPPALSPPQVSPQRHLSGTSQEEANQGTLDFLLDTSKTHAAAPTATTTEAEKSMDEGTPLSTPGHEAVTDTAAIASSVANELAKILPMRTKQDDLYARDSGSGELMDDEEEDEEDGANSRGLGIDTLLDEEDNATAQTSGRIFPINETRDTKMGEAGCMFSLASEVCDRLTKGQWSSQPHLMDPKIASDDDDDEEDDEAYGNKQRAIADSNDKQTKAMNVPFYLGSPWRQYHMSKETEPNSEETKTEGSSKRRRRHHYVPQHLPIASEGCYYGTQHYRAATPAEAPVPSSTPSTSSSQDKQHPGSMCNFPSFQF